MKLFKRFLSAPKPQTLIDIVPEASPSDVAMVERVRPFTMTSPERLWALLQAVKYVSARKIPGDFVECGVWRGGSSMLAALTFQEARDIRKFWLYDTFEGMPAPTSDDVRAVGGSAAEKFEQTADGEFSDWCRASLDDVKANMASTGYSGEVEYIKGKVEDTLPKVTPKQISILRLDTDWYESTKAELEILYPLLAPGGILIIDDYGWWEGARKAVDEFFTDPVLIHRIDFTGRMIIKS